MNAAALPFGVYVLAREPDWRSAQQLGYWHTAALESEGYIHAASHEQQKQDQAGDNGIDARLSFSSQVFIGQSIQDRFPKGFHSSPKNH